MEGEKMTLFDMKGIIAPPARYVFDFDACKNYEIKPTLYKNIFIGSEVYTGWVRLFRYVGRGKWRLVY